MVSKVQDDQGIYEEIPGPRREVETSTNVTLQNCAVTTQLLYDEQDDNTSTCAAGDDIKRMHTFPAGSRASFSANESHFKNYQNHIMYEELPTLYCLKKIAGKGNVPQKGSDSMSFQYDWNHVGEVLMSKYRDITECLDITEFIDDLANHKCIEEQFHRKLKVTRKPVCKLKMLLEYVLHEKDRIILKKLICHDDLTDLHLMEKVDDSENHYWTQHSTKVLEESLDSTEVDVISDHMYSLGYFDQIMRDDVIREKRRINKIRQLVSSVTTKKAYLCLLNVLEKIHTVEDIRSQMSKQHDTSDNAKLSSLERHATEDFIARYILQECSTKLLSDLLPSQVDYFVDVLYQKHILDAEMRDDIHQETKSRIKIRIFITKLRFAGYKGLLLLKKLLDDTGSTHIKMCLETVENKLKGMTDEEMNEMVNGETADIRGYLEMFDGNKLRQWELKTSGTREEIIDKMKQCIDLFDLDVKDIAEGSLLFTLTCHTFYGLLNFYDAYKSGHLARRFAKHFGQATENSSARFAIDKHSLITALIIFVKKEWPRESEASYYDSSIFFERELDYLYRRKRGTRHLCEEEYSKLELQKQGDGIYDTIDESDSGIGSSATSFLSPQSPMPQTQHAIDIAAVHTNRPTDKNTTTLKTDGLSE